MREPALRDDAFLADARDAREQSRGDPDALHLWWLGQSGFLVQHAGRHLLFDPYLSDSLTKKYADSDKPHVRMTARVIDPARLDFIDVVTSSHNHTDHLDGETLTALRRANPSMRIICPAANREFAAKRLEMEARELVVLDDGALIAVAGFAIHAVPAAHETLERDELGRLTHLGYVVEVGNWTVYHSGDTVLYDGMAERLRPFNVDVALLPINGSKPQRRVAGNLSGREAARLAHDIGAGVVIPCHYDMFAFNTEPPDEFIAECERLGQRYVVLENGQRWTAVLKR